MSCDRFQNLLAADALAPAEREALDAHLPTCVTCTALAHSLAEVDLGLASLGAVEPSADVVRRTINKVGDKAEVTPRGWFKWPALAAAAVAVIAVGVAITLPTGDDFGRASGEAPPMSPTVENGRSKGSVAGQPTAGRDEGQRGKSFDGYRPGSGSVTDQSQVTNTVDSSSSVTIVSKPPSGSVEGLAEVTGSDGRFRAGGDADKGPPGPATTATGSPAFETTTERLSKLEDRVEDLKRKTYKAKPRLQLLADDLEGEGDEVVFALPAGSTRTEGLMKEGKELRKQREVLNEQLAQETEKTETTGGKWADAPARDRGLRIAGGVVPSSGDVQVDGKDDDGDGTGLGWAANQPRGGEDGEVAIEGRLKTGERRAGTDKGYWKNDRWNSDVDANRDGTVAALGTLKPDAAKDLAAKAPPVRPMAGEVVDEPYRFHARNKKVDRGEEETEREQKLEEKKVREGKNVREEEDREEEEPEEEADEAQPRKANEQQKPADPREPMTPTEPERDPAAQDPTAEYLPRQALVDPSAVEPQPVVPEQPLEALSFIPADGWFENTYLPGDPSLAWLEATVANGLRHGGRDLRLQAAAAPYRQPLDAPQGAGLALHLAADRTNVEGPTRMTLQVALVGSERHAAQRAMLNAAIVVDLREVPTDDERDVLWALAHEMAKQRRAGDRLSLVVAGLDREPRLSGQGFRPAEVLRALTEALDERERLSGPDATLAEAVDAAYRSVRGGRGADDAPLGANMVVLATGGRLRVDLNERAHAEAVAGVSLTAIAAGDATDPGELGRLALAGQGRRRLVQTPNEARQTLGAELAAAGRVVARAVRLRIRLADGVKLVEVLGSRRLNDIQANRVRAAEKAIDKRVARTLGIEADRKEDDDGVLIHVPAFYAGDAHVVLLDVVVPGPGPIAESTVRYKDLVRLRNGTGSAGLSLRGGRPQPTPMTRNVLKNRLGHVIAAALADAAGQAARGEWTAAQSTLRLARARIGGLVRSQGELANDLELARDEAMLAEYEAVLGDAHRWRHNTAVAQHVQRSLEVARRKKAAPAPLR